jgi:hypothetical protein
VDRLYKNAGKVSSFLIHPLHEVEGSGEGKVTKQKRIRKRLAEWLLPQGCASDYGL